MKKSVDPRLKQEKAKYAQPIASREFILDHLQKLKGRATYQKLAKVLHIKTAEKKQALKYRLGAMIRDKQLVQINEEYRLLSDVPKAEGLISMQKDGSGLLVSEQERWILSAKQMRLLMAGDRISLRLAYMDAKNRRYGQLEEIIEQASPLVAGQYWANENKNENENKNGAGGYLVPFVANHEIKITAFAGAEPKSGS